MTDPLSDLEKSLRDLIPTPPSPQLDTRIANDLSGTKSSSPVSSFRHRDDRLLLTSLSLAIAAAIVIISMLTFDFLNAPPNAPSNFVRNPDYPNAQRFLAELTGDLSTSRIPR